jgi:methylmalonyl-CoA/ethylmalonyl-CoA epimerase
MPSGPFAHVCLLVRDLDQAIEDWRRILAELDPAQLELPIVRYDRFEAGGDVMSWATFVNPGGCEIQLLCPLNDGPLGRRLARHGEGVHHLCFTAPDLPEAVKRLAAGGVELTSPDLAQDPQLPWQHWTFVSPTTSHGVLVEVAYPYRAVDGRWEPGDGVPPAPGGPG